MDRDRVIPIVSYAVGEARAARLSRDSNAQAGRTRVYRGSAAAVASVAAIAALYYSWPGTSPNGHLENADNLAQSRLTSGNEIGPGFSIVRESEGSAEAVADSSSEVSESPRLTGDHSTLPFVGVTQFDSLSTVESPRKSIVPLVPKANSLAANRSSTTALDRGPAEGAIASNGSLVCEPECNETEHPLAIAANATQTDGAALAVQGAHGSLSNASLPTDEMADEMGDLDGEPPALLADIMSSSELRIDASGPLSDGSERSWLPHVEREFSTEGGGGSNPRQGDFVDTKSEVILPERLESVALDDDPTVPVVTSDSELNVRQVIAEHLERVDHRYSTMIPAEQTLSTEGASSSSPLATSHSSDDLGVVVPLDRAGDFSGVVLEDELVAIRLNDLVSLFEDRIDRPLYVWLRSSSSGSNYVTSETLRAAGIDARYDPSKNQIVFSLVDDKR